VRARPCVQPFVCQQIVDRRQFARPSSSAAAPDLSLAGRPRPRRGPEGERRTPEAAVAIHHRRSDVKWLSAAVETGHISRSEPAPIATPPRVRCEQRSEQALSRRRQRKACVRRGRAEALPLLHPSATPVEIVAVSPEAFGGLEILVAPFDRMAGRVFDPIFAASRTAHAECRKRLPYSARAELAQCARCRSPYITLRYIGHDSADVPRFGTLNHGTCNACDESSSPRLGPRRRPQRRPCGAILVPTQRYWRRFSRAQPCGPVPDCSERQLPPRHENLQGLL